MDVLLWILLGLAGGFGVAALMPEMSRRSPSESAWRSVRSMVVGASGAIAAGYGLVRFQPSHRTESLTTTLAALAGALWLAGIVEVYASRRRRGESSAAAAQAPAGSPPATHMPAYDSARQALVAGLLEDALAHEAGRYAEIGRKMPAIRATVSRQDPAWNSRLQLAVGFWSGWSGWSEARGRWDDDDLENPIATGAWPRLARTIASDLALDRDTTDPVIVAHFGRAACAPPTAAAARWNR
jgi:hypothetical protein